jgi:hypothetical protein
MPSFKIHFKVTLKKKIISKNLGSYAQNHMEKHVGVAWVKYHLPLKEDHHPFKFPLSEANAV